MSIEILKKKFDEKKHFYFVQLMSLSSLQILQTRHDEICCDQRDASVSGQINMLLAFIIKIIASGFINI